MIGNLFRPVLHGMAVLAFPATGRHRAGEVLLVHEPGLPVRARGVLEEARLEELLDGWPERVPGAVAATCFDDCPTCERATAGVLHKDGWTCGECFTPVPAGGAS